MNAPDNLYFMYSSPFRRREDYLIAIGSGQNLGKPPIIFRTPHQVIACAVFVALNAGWRPPGWNGGNHAE